MALAFHDWQSGRQPGPPYNRCSPNLQAITQEMGKRFGGYSLGCYALRPIRGGVAWSSHSFGAAIDWRIESNPLRTQAINWLVANHDMLGVQSIHDYVGSRIWHSDRKAWKTQPKNTSTGMGQTWAKYLHIETNPDRWADGRAIAVRTGALPGDDGLIKAAPPGIPFSLKMGGTPDPFRTRWLQQVMNERFGSTLTIDGGFGQATHNAVLVMQGVLDAQPDIQVARDGIYGQQTAAALAAWLAVH